MLYDQCIYKSYSCEFHIFVATNLELINNTDDLTDAILFLQKIFAIVKSHVTMVLLLSLPDQDVLNDLSRDLDGG